MATDNCKGLMWLIYVPINAVK